MTQSGERIGKKYVFEMGILIEIRRSGESEESREGESWSGAKGCRARGSIQVPVTCSTPLPFTFSFRYFSPFLFFIFSSLVCVCVCVCWWGSVRVVEGIPFLKPLLSLNGMEMVIVQCKKEKPGFLCLSFFYPFCFPPNMALHFLLSLFPYAPTHSPMKLVLLFFPSSLQNHFIPFLSKLLIWDVFWDEHSFPHLQNHPALNYNTTTGSRPVYLTGTISATA